MDLNTKLHMASRNSSNIIMNNDELHIIQFKVGDEIKLNEKMNAYGSFNDKCM